MKNIIKFFDKPSRIILAVDKLITEELENLVIELSDILLGVKIGIVPFLEGETNKIRSFISKARKHELYVLADFKLADVSHVMLKICKKLYENGFHGVIAHAFVGRKGALESLIEFGNRNSFDIFLVVAMSHPGAEEILNENFEKMLNLAKELQVTGVIAPATMPHYVARARKILGNHFVILSPGIGPQGGKPGDALKHGADAEIIGRMILNSSNPLETARDIATIHRGVLSAREKRDCN